MANNADHRLMCAGIVIERPRMKGFYPLISAGIDDSGVPIKEFQFPFHLVSSQYLKMFAELSSGACDGIVARVDRMFFAFWSPFSLDERFKSSLDFCRGHLFFERH